MVLLSRKSLINEQIYDIIQMFKRYPLQVFSGKTPVTIAQEMLSSILRKAGYGSVAQLVRAPPCHGGGHGFESRQSRLRNVAQFGRALRSGRRSRRFKSCHSDVIRFTYINLVSREKNRDRESVVCCTAHGGFSKYLFLSWYV